MPSTPSADPITPSVSVAATTPRGLLSPATAEALELPILLQLYAELAASDLGRRAILELTPLTQEEALHTRRSRFEEVRRLLRDSPLVPSFEGAVSELFERLETGRPPVTGNDLVRLKDFLHAVREAGQRIAEADPPCPNLSELVDGLPDLSDLERRIGEVLDRRGDVRDDASSELVELRGKIRKIRSRLYEELGQYVQEHRETLAEETIPMRGGRLVLMLPSGSRGRLPGLTHGRSGSGKSFYFEPLGVVEDNNTLQQAVEDEEEERLRLLNDLIRRAGAVLSDLERQAEVLSELDLLQAAVRFAAETDARLPEVGPRHELHLAGARHPLLDPRLARLREAALGQPGHREAVVPLDLSLSADQRVLVITGPNAGGKTVALKTVGLLAAAAQCGLPVTVAAGSRLPFLESLVALVGDEQDLLTDRSTFSGRLLRLQEAWEAAGPDSLLLLDELGSGTDPEEGSALSVALLEGLLEKGSTSVITTHLIQLAASASEMEAAGCAAMEFDADTGEPTFRMVPGPPGGSEALALARRLGLPPEWLDRAEELVGSEHRKLRGLLEEVERIRRELEATHERAEREATDAEKLRRRLEEEERELKEERQSLARKLRDELESFRRETRQRLRQEIDRLREEVEAGRRKGVAEKATERLFEEAPELPVEEPAAAGPLVVGSKVRHRGLGWEGTLEKLEGGKAEVNARGKRLRLSADELTPVDDEPSGEKAARKGRGKVSLERSTAEVPEELHLLGRRVEQALAELDGYLDRALLSERREVRIVHGHGTGRLRQAVREHLRGHPAIESQRPGREEEGGNGATVVQLRG